MRFAARLVAGVVGLSLLAALSAQANLVTGQTVTVSETGVYGEVVNISSTGFYTGGAWAGIYELNVDGHAMQGFCIDPWEYSPSSPSGYTVNALQNAPVDAQVKDQYGNKMDPGPMSAANATEIKKLWAQYFRPAEMSPSAAKDLQLAIWLIVGGSNFHVTDAAPSGFNSWNEWLNHYEAAAANATPANLVALSGANEQDYAVATPDGGTTVGLLGMAFTALAIWRRKS